MSFRRVLASLIVPLTVVAPLCAQQPEEKVLRADELVTEALGLGTRITQDAFSALAQWLVRHG